MSTDPVGHSVVVTGAAPYIGRATRPHLPASDAASFVNGVVFPPADGWSAA
ncbi:hypothetical protein ACIF8T_35900 [Streptomyces sp. NPDC085946]|uniref:hypothetical protein n=1 Tax=Streptomyces sp. NPDC085946 TaxID=3365744 RepID=UPI0037D0A6A5